MARRDAAGNTRFRGVRPALPVLQADQRALLERTDNPRYSDEYHLRPGFETRRAVIQWFQRAIVRTFGHIADKRPAEDQLTFGPLLGVLIIGEERQRWLHDHGGDTLTLEQARLAREKYEATTVIPACHDAYNDLLDVAGEYINQDDGPGYYDLEPDAQRNLAMRPGFQHLDEQQHEALIALWDGFQDREALFEWVHGLDQPTNGAIRDDLAALFAETPSATSRMLTDQNGIQDAEHTRNAVAVRILLPAFVDGIKRMSAGELADARQERKDPNLHA